VCSEKAKVIQSNLKSFIRNKRGDPSTTAKIEWLKAKWQGVTPGEEVTMMDAILFISPCPRYIRLF
jgi:hypothetical protein